MANQKDAPKKDQNQKSGSKDQPQKGGQKKDSQSTKK